MQNNSALRNFGVRASLPATAATEGRPPKLGQHRKMIGLVEFYSVFSVNSVLNPSSLCIFAVKFLQEKL